jgi:hypothetical protein
VKSLLTKGKYESWKVCNTWVNFHVYESFIKIFERKNKIKYNSGFCLNFLVVLVWSNMYDTIGYLHRTLQTCAISKPHDALSSPMMFDRGRTCPTKLLEHKKKTIKKPHFFYICVQYERNKHRQTSFPLVTSWKYLVFESPSSNPLTFARW